MKGPLVLLGALVVGILLGDARGPDPAGWVLALSTAGVGGAWALRTRPRAALAVAVVAVVLLGVAVEQRARHGLTVSPLTAPMRRGATVTCSVTLTEDPSGPQYVTEALATVDRCSVRPGGGRTVLLRVTGDEQSALRVLEAGDRLRVQGRLTPLSGFSTRLRWRHAVAAVEVERVDAVAEPDRPWFVVANAARGVVMRGADTLPATPRALLAGFVLGDTRAIPSDLVDDFRASGLSHLLAVSGANVAFALAIAEPFLRRRRLGTRLVGGLAVLAVFGTMTRWEPSVLRAAAMAGLVMLARWMGRPTDAGRVLTYAMLGLLVADPFLLHSVGFLLSCGACAGIAVGRGADRTAAAGAGLVPGGARRDRGRAGRGRARPARHLRHGPARGAPGQPPRGAVRRTAHDLGARGVGDRRGGGAGHRPLAPAPDAGDAAQHRAHRPHRREIPAGAGSDRRDRAHGTIVLAVLGLRFAYRRAGSVGGRGRRLSREGWRPDPARP